MQRTDVEWDGLEGALAEARRRAGDRHRGPAHGAESPGVPWEPSLGGGARALGGQEAGYVCTDS